MVVFCCNKCGESLKKNQVEKHAQNVCRGSCNVSCMDCQKDFVGDAYQTHTKCISEVEKYSAPGFVAKVNKGEVKQDLWIQQVHSAIKKSLNNPRLKDVLQRLLDFPNIPRKKQKFQNFLSNSMCIRDRGLITQVWDIMLAEKEEKKEEETQAQSADAQVQKSSSSENSTEKEEPTADMEEEVSEKKLSKRERKEARRKKQNKVEKKEKRAEAQAAQGEASEEDEDHQSTKKKKKSKKRKREEEAESAEAPQTQNGHKKKKNAATEDEDGKSVGEGKKKKKKKKQKERAEANGVLSDQAESSMDAQMMRNGVAKDGKKHKKRSLPDEETGAMDTSTADETMKSDGDDDNENGMDDDEDAPEQTTAKSHRKIQVEDLVVKILRSKEELPVKKLKKKVLQEFAAQGAMSKSREAVWAKVEKKLKKNPRFKLHKERVKLLH